MKERTNGGRAEGKSGRERRTRTLTRAHVKGTERERLRRWKPVDSERKGDEGSEIKKYQRVRFVAPPINFECTRRVELVACWVMIKKNYKQKIPRMASLFRGSARQAENACEKL